MPFLLLTLLFSGLLIGIDLPAQGAGYQRQGRFKAGILVGLNLAQVDGDNYQGFRRLGLEGGLQGITVLNRNNLLSTEILFSQRGSAPSRRENRRQQEYRLRLRLNYIEVPLIYHHLFNEGENGWFSHNYHIGLSFARLIGTRIEESAYASFITPSKKDLLIKERRNIRNNDISLIFGATLYINRSFGLTARGTVSITPFYIPETTSALRSYYLTLGGSYVIE